MSQPRDYPVTAHNKNRSAQVIQVESRQTPVLIAVACISLITAGIAVGLAMRSDARSEYANERAEEAYKKGRMAEMRTEGFTRALIAKGIDPYPHVEGEAP